MHASPQDAHNRGMYGQGYHLPQQMYGYPQYTLPQQPSYAQHSSAPQSYPAISQSPQMQLPNQAPVPLLQQAPNYPQSAILNTKAQVKREPSPPMQAHGFAMNTSGAAQMKVQGQDSLDQDASGQRGDPNTAAPGPIPATTPLVVRQDQNGVQWIAFEYSRDRVKLEYTIRCDVESVNVETLSDDFKSANCVYPRACGGKDQYKGNRLHYESECNAVGWALAELNPNLREKRGLIQRAVDSWRNSNQDPRLRSRRVRRMAKIHTRKAQQSTPALPTPMSIPVSQANTGNAYGKHMGLSQLGLAAGQLNQSQSTMNGNDGTTGHDGNGIFHHM